MTTPAWVPETPVGWVVDQTRRYFEVKKELNSDRSISQVLSLTLRGVVQNDPDNPEGLVPSDYGTYQIFDEGDLVFKLIDLENLRTSRVGLVPESGIMSSAYIRLVPRSSMDSRFAYWYYYSLWVRNIYNQLGGGVRATLGSADLLALPVVVPPMEEQRRIADFLDDQVGRIDQAIGLRGRQEAAYSDLLESRIEELIYGLKELPSSEPSGGHLAATIAVNRAPSEWRRCRLKSVAQRSRAIRGDTSAPLLSLSSQGFLRTRADDQQPPADASLPRYLLVKPDDLVVNPMWLLGGAIAVSNMSGAVSPDYRAFHLDHSVAPRYVHHLLRSRLYMDQYKLYMRADTTFDRRVQQHDLDNMPIALPPRYEQVSRAAVLDRSASEALKIEEAFAGWKQVLEERKRALITAAVTGQLDITVARPLTAPWVSSGLSASVESPVVSVGVAL